jgi:hypothetical protein
MNHLKTLLIFLVLFGVLALYRESIKTNIIRQREEKKNADYNNINPETESFVSEIENDNYHYVPKKIYTRGTGINENGYNFNYEGNLKNDCPYKWNNENAIGEQEKLLNKHKSKDAKYVQLSGFDKKESGIPQTYLRNGDFLKNITNNLLDSE